MAEIEKRARIRAQKRNFQRAILGSVAAVGLLATTALAPALPGALKKLGMIPTGPSDIGAINRARNRLLKKGLLLRTREGFLKLTPAGKRAWLMAQAVASRTRTPRKWDGRWRMLIFDIPEKRKATRDKTRRMLTMVGFVRLQDSVWIYPYNCEDFVALLKADLKIGRDMLYLIVDEMEADASVRRHFNVH
jgi:CRISPR-associated endonuclease Cas2